MTFKALSLREVTEGAVGEKGRGPRTGAPPAAPHGALGGEAEGSGS